MTSPASHVSPEQATTNRTNAQHSTGPRTPEGKARVAQNALKHGLFAEDANSALETLGEDPAEFAALLADLLKDWAPADRSEEELVHEMAALRWRLARLQYFARLALAEKITEGEDALTAIRGAEAIGPDEGRLQRALSRANRDLVFLQKFRLGEQRRLNKRQPALRELFAEFDADTERLVQALNRRSPEREADGGEVKASQESGVPDPALEAENTPETSEISPVEAIDPGETTEPDQWFAGEMPEQSQFAAIGQST